MKVHTVDRKNGKGIWRYAEYGRTKRKSNLILLFLHGFGADLDSWVSVVRYLPSDFHFICLDMPGHG
jgi:pimeloyl-ACP methyl ester carboxylesterase